MIRRKFALLVLIAVICPFAAAALRCDVSVPAPAYLRPNGLTELLADIVLTCDGDAPSGGIASDINLFFNTQTYGFGSTGPPVILSGEGKNGWKIGDNVFAAQTLTGNQIHWSQVKLMPQRYRFTESAPICWRAANGPAKRDSRCGRDQGSRSHAFRSHGRSDHSTIRHRDP